MIVRDDTFGNNKQDDDEGNKICEILKDAFLDINMIILSLVSVISIIFGLLKEYDLMMFEGTSIIISCILVSGCNA